MFEVLIARCCFSMGLLGSLAQVENRHQKERFFAVYRSIAVASSIALVIPALGCGETGKVSGSSTTDAQSEQAAGDSNDVLSASQSQSLALDVNQFLGLSTDNTESATVALGTRYASAAKVTPTASQMALLTTATKQPAVPTSGDNSDLVYKTFAVTLYPSNGGQPNPIDIMQHAIGNCDGDAALAALAYVHPSYIKSLIRATSATTWDVSMITPTGSPITVSVDNHFVATSDGSIAAVSGRNGAPNWATVLEKAMMKYNLVYGVSPSTGMGQLGGIGSEHTLPMFTGSGLSYAFDRGKLSDEQLRQEVLNALDNGMLITGGFGIEQNIDGYRTVTGHAYTVLWPKDANTMISMRNPWGVAVNATTGNYDATADGVINISDVNWAATIDLRVIDPGKAGHAAMTLPYVPQASRRATANDVEMISRAIEDRKRQGH